MMRAELPVEPFRGWLARKVELYGVAGVADRIGVDEARVRAILRGTYRTHGRMLTINGLRLNTVDRWMTAFDDHYLELYDYEEKAV